MKPQRAQAQAYGTETSVGDILDARKSLFFAHGTNVTIAEMC